MTSFRQIEANRRNARKTAGSTTEEGVQLFRDPLFQIEISKLRHFCRQSLIGGRGNAFLIARP